MSGRDRRRREHAAVVPHPRYGREFRISKHPTPPADDEVGPHWIERTSCNLATAIPADPSRQTHGGFKGPAQWWADCLLGCSECGRTFLFFAEEQRFWYETLGFHLYSRCDRCVPCRQERGLKLRRFTNIGELFRKLKSEPQTLTHNDLIRLGEFISDSDRLRPDRRVERLGRVRNLAVKLG